MVDRNVIELHFTKSQALLLFNAIVPVIMTVIVSTFFSEKYLTSSTKQRKVDWFSLFSKIIMWLIGGFGKASFTLCLPPKL